ncbi:NEDD8-activating enzyme E1 regulatory subunit AXR1-like protein [Tanacetum coccineum]
MVTVYSLIYKETLEEKILQRASQKSTIQQLVMTGGHVHGDLLAPEDIVSLLIDDPQLEQILKEIPAQFRSQPSKRWWSLNPETLEVWAVGFYILLRAVDRFAANYTTFPGHAMDEEISRLKTTAVGLLSDLGCNGSTLIKDLINEMCRSGAAELHAVATYVGEVASHEIIKMGG